MAPTDDGSPPAAAAQPVPSVLDEKRYLRRKALLTVLCFGGVAFELLCCGVFVLFGMAWGDKRHTVDEYVMQLIEALCCVGVLYSLWESRRDESEGQQEQGSPQRIFLLNYLVFNAIDIPAFVYGEVPASMVGDDHVWVWRTRGSLTLEVFNREVSESTIYLFDYYSLTVNLYWAPALITWFIAFQAYLAMRPAPTRQSLDQRRTGWRAIASIVREEFSSGAGMKMTYTACTMQALQCVLLADLYTVDESFPVLWHFLLVQLGSACLCLLFLYSRREKWHYVIYPCLAAQVGYLVYMLGVGLPLLIGRGVHGTEWLSEGEFAHFLSTHGGDPTSSLEAYKYFRMLESGLGSEVRSKMRQLLFLEHVSLVIWLFAFRAMVLDLVWGAEHTNGCGSCGVAGNEALEDVEAGRR